MTQSIKLFVMKDERYPFYTFDKNQGMSVFEKLLYVPEDVYAKYQEALSVVNEFQDVMDDLYENRTN